jgi:DNA-binding NarL/FixJ family response regulator
MIVPAGSFPSSREQVAPPEPGRCCTVLICDDQPQLRQTLRDVLSHNPHFTVIGEAVDGATCLQALRLGGPDVLILDVNMPGGGPQIARAAKQLQPSTYILVFTGRDAIETEREMLDAGADAYLVKTGRLRPLLGMLTVACVARRPDG